MTLLAIDVGNTRLKWALYEQPGLHQPALAHGAVFLERIEDLGEKDLRALPKPDYVLGCCVASEAAKISVNEQLEERWHITPNWAQVREQQCGVVNGYDAPARLGIDRWMSLIGARQRLLAENQHCPAIIVMVGTAVTVDTLTAGGLFLGGMIMPGYGIMMSSLQSGTAGLNVPTGEVVPFPTNTSNALTTGGTYAITGAIERMTHNLREYTGQEPHLFLTGGAAWKVAPSLTTPFTLVESLIFDGLLSVAAELKDISFASIE